MNVTKWIAGLMAVTALASCSKDDTLPAVDGELVPVEFRASIYNETRAHDGQWDPNDDIGLTMLERNTTRIIGNVYNYDYYTEGTAGLFEPRNQNRAIYFPQDGSEVSFRGYYPYKPSLARDMVIPVRVQNQSVLPDIDLMTADHVAGFSNQDKVVHLNFHHRLSKLIFNLHQQDGEEVIDLQGITLTIQGMKTEGTYDLLEELLHTNTNSVAPITFPYRNDPDGRYGIVLPRSAGPGVTFAFTTPDGGRYTAAMSSTLALEPGYQYIFHVTLRETESMVTAEVEPWIDGPTTYYDALQIGGAFGSNEGAIEGDEMNVYLQENNGFNLLSTFTFNGANSWTPDPIVYWEEIPGDPAVMRASLVRVDALNDLQMPDVLVSENVSVARNRGAHFVLNRAATKLFIELQSTTFSAQQLHEALIALPGYKTGGEVIDGAYVPGGADQRADIPVYRDNSDTGIALINPQDVSPGGAILDITIDGRHHRVLAGTTGMSYQAGVANHLVVTIEEQAASVSARVVDWVNGTPSNFTALEFGTPAGNSVNVAPNTVMTVFMQEPNVPWTADYDFTYGNDGVWRTDPAIYWDALPGNGPYTMRSWVMVDNNPPAGQIADYLVSDELTVQKFYGANFELTHAPSRVVIGLTSSTFDPQDLAGATVILPDYLTGGTYANGIFTPGTTPQDITLSRNSSGFWVGTIQPQVVVANDPIVQVVINTKTYTAKAPAEFMYNRGEIMNITIHIEEDALSLSAKANDWTNASADLTVLTPGTTHVDSEGINDGERMEVYYTDLTGTAQTSVYTYSATGSQWSSTNPVIWNNIRTGSTINATLFRQEAPYNATQLADQMVLSAPVTASGTDANVHFDFIHPASKLIIEVTGDDYFTPEQVAAMTFTLPNYRRGGQVARGQFTRGSLTGNITVAQGVGEGNAQAIAIVDPQTIPQGNTIIQIQDPNGPVYTATYNAPLILNPGQATVLRLTLTKTALNLSARAVDWLDQTPLNLNVSSIQVDGSLIDSDDFFRNKTIYLYKWGGSQPANFWQDTYTFLPGQNGNFWSGTPRYWDDQQAPYDFTAVYYPVENNTPTVNNGTTSFVWNVPADQSGGYTNSDILTNRMQMSTPHVLNFDFIHALSKITVELVSDEFSPTELQQATVVLNNLVVNGNIAMPSGLADGSGSTAAPTVTPWRESTVTRLSALVYPQRIATGAELVTVTLQQYPNTPFHGILSRDLTLVGGQNHVVTIRLRRTAIDLSARVEPWGNGQTGEIIIQ